MAALVVFSILLLITRNMIVACIGMAIAAAATFVVVTFPLTLLETPKERSWSAASIGQLFKNCAPLFVALFLYAVIDNMPKFVMEGTLSYDNQLYFNALYFPAQASCSPCSWSTSRFLCAWRTYGTILRNAAASI